MATQYICGKLFIEFWSSDKENGFPVPQGCYHRGYSNYRILYIVFSAKNGLNSDTVYQVVLNAAAMPGLSNDQEYVQIIPITQVTQQPYIAAEIGKAYVTQLPQTGAGNMDPQFLNPGGFEIYGGTG